VHHLVATNFRQKLSTPEKAQDNGTAEVSTREKKNLITAQQGKCLKKNSSQQGKRKAG